VISAVGTLMGNNVDLAAPILLDHGTSELASEPFSLIRT
jgi:hypothetical protein